jgi:hypothetical protein
MARRSSAYEKGLGETVFRVRSIRRWTRPRRPVLLALVRRGGAFALRREAGIVWYPMSLRSTGLAGVTSLMVLGCATDQPFDTTETPQERAQRERQERAERVNLGRIGELDRAPRSTVAPRPRGSNPNALDWTPH